MLSGFLFYIFASVLVVSALLAVLSKNYVHSVLWLVLAFFNASWLYLMLSYEFIAMLLVIVYVGAIATLFLFVVMMVDVGKAIKSDKKITALATIVSIVLCVEILLSISNIKHSLSAVQVVTEEANFNNTKDLGMIIYTDFFYGFQLVGFILFVAMVGVVHVISTSGAMDSAIPQKRQSSIKQILRNPKSSISIVKVKSRSGVSDIEGNDN